jgi:hypothetical protein
MKASEDMSEVELPEDRSRQPSPWSQPVTKFLLSMAVLFFVWAIGATILALAGL